MIKRYGPGVRAVFILLEAYKGLIHAGHRAGLSKKKNDDIINEFNHWFYAQGDVVDSYLERIFDVLLMPRCPLLRRISGEVALKFLTNEADGITVITTILMFKEEHRQDEAAFHKKYKGKF